MEDMAEAVGLGCLLGIWDAVRTHWHIVLAIVASVLIIGAVLVVTHVMLDKDRQDCRAQGGNPQNHNGSVVCVKGGEIIE